MSSGDIYLELVRGQRRRMTGAILGHLEREVYPLLTAEQREATRQKVLDSVGVFSDFVVDCLRGASKGALINEDAVRMLDQISRGVRALDQKLEEFIEDEYEGD